MTKDKSGKPGSKKRRRDPGDWQALRYAGAPVRSGEPDDADAADGTAQASAAGPATTAWHPAATWRAADEDRWATDRLLDQCAHEHHAARRIHGRALGFFLGLPLLFGLACLVRGVTPPADDSAVPALRVVALLTMLAALGAWLIVLRTRVRARPPLEELGWEPGAPSERRAAERLVSARRRLEGCVQQARNEVDALEHAADRAFMLSAVSVGCLGLLFAIAALA